MIKCETQYLPVIVITSCTCNLCGSETWLYKDSLFRSMADTQQATKDSAVGHIVNWSHGGEYLSAVFCEKCLTSLVDKV